jgi:hypothetical protein
LNLRDSESEPGATGSSGQPEAPRAPDYAPDNNDVEFTQVGPVTPTPKISAKPAPAPDDTKPILGVVVIYSETHELNVAERDSKLGRVYPLREGEILLVGRHHSQPEVLLRNGEKSAPTHCHFFPHGGIYGFVSRTHLTVEMDPLGGTIVTDYSRHGIYLNKAKKSHLLKNHPTPESHSVTGDETIILMDSLGEPTDQDLADQRSYYTLDIVRSARKVMHDRVTEETP